MEKYHEVLQPVRQVVHDLGEKVLNWVLPTDVISEVFNGVQRESAERTVQMYTQGKLFEE